MARTLQEVAQDLNTYIREHEQAIADYTELMTVASMENNRKMMADLELRFGSVMEPYRKLTEERARLGAEYQTRRAQKKQKKQIEQPQTGLDKVEKFLLGPEGEDYDKWIASQRSFDPNKAPTKR